MTRSNRTITVLHNMIHSAEFVMRHRKNSTAFTRQRKLTFATVVSVILRLARKSLQIECNLLGDQQMMEPASKQAFSKARHNIAYTGFKELNTAFLQNAYAADETGTWYGYRVFGIDGSTIKLPKSDETIDYFGVFTKGTDDPKKCPVIARVSEVVELTTGIIASAELSPLCFGERRLAQDQITDVAKLFHEMDQSKQLYVFDRGYVSKDLMRTILELQVDFLFRLPRGFNTSIDKLVDQGVFDQQVEIQGLPALRLIVINLTSGEKCVLLTSLLTPEISADSVCRLYWLRWIGCEEGYKKQKIQLELENFSGTSLEAILQEFWATVLTLNVFLLQCVDEEGPWDPENPPDYRINRSVVFGSLRDTVFQTIMGQYTPEELRVKFQKIARRGKVKIRPGRQFSRQGVGKPKRHHVFRRIC